MPNLVGQSLGRYNILEQIGEGGMATVYRAYDTHLERDIAIKIIRRQAFPEEQLEQILKRFEREAKALARLTHPNIVPVIDYGEYEGAPYLVMIYLPGGALRQPIGTPRPWQEAVRILLPVAEALAYAHGHNIVHRDIKPSNILLTEKGQPMLSDFGIAKILGGSETATLTGTGAGVGTPGYMAPEQWTGHTVPQSDIYSLGVVLYELVTGRKPYTGDTPAAILLKQATEPLPRPSQFVPGLPGSVEEMLQKALARDPADRYADMTDFIGRLEELLVVSPLPARSTLPLRREDSKASVEQNEKQKIQLQETVQANRDAEENTRRQAEINHLSGEVQSAIRKNNWERTEQLAGELAGLGEAGKSAAAGLLEQMKEKRTAQQSKELARLHAEEQAKLKEARRIEELRKKKEQNAAEQERLKEEAAKRKEMAAQQAAEEKTRREEAAAQLASEEKARKEEQARQRIAMVEQARREAEERTQREAQAHAQRLTEITGLQPEIEKALAAQQWGTVRQLISQLKNLGPEGRAPADRLKKYLPKPKMPRWAWMVGGVVLAGIILFIGGSILRNFIAQTPSSITPGLAAQVTGNSAPGVGFSETLILISSTPTLTPTPFQTQTATYTLEYTPSVTSLPQAVLRINANIRSGPGTVYPILTVYIAGTTVQILGRNHAGDWLAIGLPGDKRGWVALSSLQVGMDVNSLSELAAPPAPTPPPTATEKPHAPPPHATPTWAK